MFSKLKDFCFTFSVAIYVAVPSAIAIVDPAFRSDYAHIAELSLPVLIASFSKSKQGAKGKSVSGVDD